MSSKDCETCDGTGWVCGTCGLNGNACACPANLKEPLDCQECEGLGEDDFEDDFEDEYFDDEDEDDEGYEL